MEKKNKIKHGAGENGIPDGLGMGRRVGGVRRENRTDASNKNTCVGGVGFGVHARRHRAVGRFLVAQVLGRFGSLFHPSRGLFVFGAHRGVVAVVPVVGRPFGRTGRRRPSLMMRVHGWRVVGRAAGRRLRPVVMVMVVRRFRLGGRGQPVVQRRRRRRPAVVVRGAAAVAVGRRQQRVLAAPGYLVLDEPTYVRQQEHSLALAASQQIHLVGTAGALCGVRIRWRENKIRKRKNTKLHENISNYFNINEQPPAHKNDPNATAL